jgi:predicted  nucleic acid-binding Zn-ribbon protein
VKKEKEKILKDMELHSRAREIIEHEVQRYGKELFKISQRIARLDGEKDIITTSNVKRAMLSLWKGSSPYRDYFWE